MPRLRVNGNQLRRWRIRQWILTDRQSLAKKLSFGALYFAVLLFPLLVVIQQHISMIALPTPSRRRMSHDFTCAVGLI
jgi:hypothetical protein